MLTPNSGTGIAPSPAPTSKPMASVRMSDLWDGRIACRTYEIPKLEKLDGRAGELTVGP